MNIRTEEEPRGLCALVQIFPNVPSVSHSLQSPNLSLHRRPFVGDNEKTPAQDKSLGCLLECLQTDWRLDLVSQYLLLPSVAFELLLHHLLCVFSLGE